MINRAYKFRLYPNKTQQQMLQQHFGATRFVYNYFLEKKITTYKQTKKTISWNQLANELPKMKQTEEYSWLKDIGSTALQQTIINLDKAYLNFFRSGFGFPKFKSKKTSKKSFTFPNTGNTSIKIDTEGNRISIPKFIKTSKHDNRLKCIFSRTVNGKIKSGTISQDKDGKYYISLLCEVDQVIPTKPEVLRETTIGIDFGVKTFLTFDDGTKIDNPLYLEQSSKKLAKLQQELANLQKDTTAYRSKKEQITRQHSKIARQRKDFLDKLTYRLCHENQVDTICIEDLSMKEMQKENYSSTNKKLGDLAWNMFVNMLQYKANWYGKNVIKIGKFEPSSKTCNNCGYVNHELTLSDREWTCPKCGQTFDRDVNAAKNIKDFALPNMNFNKRVGTTLSNGNYLK